FRGVAVPVVPDVPAVDVREGRPQDSLAGRSDHDRRRRPTGKEHGVVEVLERPVEGDPLASQQTADDLEGLLEPCGTVVEGEAEGGELGLVPSGAEAEDQ